MDHPAAAVSRLVTLAAFLEFARSLPDQELAACLEGAEPLSPIRRHVFPASRWHRFERMLGGRTTFVVVGDAVCGFDPVHGQGMTVGAMNGVALARALERPKGAQVPGFARRLQRELARRQCSGAPLYRARSAGADAHQKRDAAPSLPSRCCPQ